MTSRTVNERFAAFDIELKRRGRGRWKWAVRGTDGQAVMRGSESSRAGARYKAHRALFLVLLASASRRPGLPPEPSDLPPRAAALSEGRARGPENRTTIEGSRQPRKVLSNNAAKQRSAHATFAAPGAKPRHPVRRAARRFRNAGKFEL